MEFLDFQMKLSFSDILMIFAVLLSPLIALRVEKWLEELRSKNDRKNQIFKTLMATRATPLHPDHIIALNMIDIEFSERNPKEKPVVEAWRNYLAHLEDCPTELGLSPEADARNYSTKLEVWNQSTIGLLVKLLFAMAQCLGYPFSEVLLKKGMYRPKGHYELENQNEIIRRGLIGIIYGQIPIKMSVVDFPVSSDGEQKEQQEIRSELLKVLRGESPLPVKVSEFNPTARERSTKATGGLLS